MTQPYVSSDWSSTSWKAKPAAQFVTYPCQEEVERIVQQISKLPPLVTSWEVLDLKSQLADAVRGARFVLQGGDCAERLVDCKPARVTNTLKVLVQVSLVLVVGAERPVIRIGRFAGQYAKPRSANTETRDARQRAAGVIEQEDCALDKYGPLRAVARRNSSLVPATGMARMHPKKSQATV